jgi:hypothetical protein
MMTKIRAVYFFKAMSFLFLLLSIFAGMLSYLNTEISATTRVVLTAIGGALLFVSFIGPTRILLLRPTIPKEIFKTISIIGLFLPLASFLLLIIGIYPEKIVHTISFALLSFSFLIISVFVFYRLSKKLALDFYMTEMLSIIQSANIFNSNKENLADREYKHWSSGSEGIAINTNAPNGDVFKLNGEKSTLLDYLNDEAPNSHWIINFGSYTCPHHRKRINELKSLQKKWKNKDVRLLTIYTAEAHPEDGWQLTNQYVFDKEFTGCPQEFCFYQARKIEDRIKMANWFITKKEFKSPILIDNMENSLLRKYNSWPIRLYILHQEKILFCGQQGPFGYAPKEVDNYLSDLFKDR